MERGDQEQTWPEVRRTKFPPNVRFALLMIDILNFKMQLSFSYDIALALNVLWTVQKRGTSTPPTVAPAACHLKSAQDW